MGAAEETRVIKRIFFFGVLPLIVYAVLVGKFIASHKAIDKDIQFKKSKIKRFYDQGINVPEQASIDARVAKIAEERKQVESLANYGSFSLKEVPADIAEPGVYFKEKLYLTHKELKSLGEKHQVNLPGKIGFTEKLPEESEVPVLLLKLELVDKILRILIENQAKTITLIEFLESATLVNAAEKKMPVENISFRLEASCSLKALKKALYEIGNLNPVVIVEGLNVQQNQNEVLDVSLHITELLYTGY